MSRSMEPLKNLLLYSLLLYMHVPLFFSPSLFILFSFLFMFLFHFSGKLLQVVFPYLVCGL